MCSRATPGVILWFTVGSGKTLASISAAENLALCDSTPLRPVLVVLPASLADNFRKELRAAAVPNPQRYSIYSFDAFLRLPTLQRIAKGTNAMLIVDEAHTLRSATSKKLGAVMDASRVAHKRLLLTGTPIMNFGMDLGPLLALVDPDHHAVHTVGPRVPYDGAGKAPMEHQFGKFAGHAATSANSRRKLEAMLRCTLLYYTPDARATSLHYPRVVEQWVRVPMSATQISAHFSEILSIPVFEDERYDAGEFDSIGAFMTTLRKHTLSIDDDNKPKLDAAIARLVAAARANRKCVVWSFFKKSSLAILEHSLRVAGVKVAAFTGDVPIQNKTRIIQAYNAGTLQVLLLSDAGKEGLDLKNTAEMHLLEPSWNEEKIRQVIGRGVRFQSHAPGSTVQVYRYITVLPPGAFFAQPLETQRKLREHFDVVDAPNSRIGKDKSGVDRLLVESVEQLMQALTNDKQKHNLSTMRWLREVAARNARECFGALRLTPNRQNARNAAGLNRDGPPFRPSQAGRGASNGNRVYRPTPTRVRRSNSNSNT